MYGRLFTLKVRRSSEAPHGCSEEAWLLIQQELLAWAQTLTPFSVRGIVEDPNHGSAYLLFDNEVARAKVAAEYEQVLLWKDTE